MPTEFAEWTSRTSAWPIEGQLETAIDDGLESSDGISARGLEILRVLNDVFNTLPREAMRSQQFSQED